MHLSAHALLLQKDSRDLQGEDDNRCNELYFPKHYYNELKASTTGLPEDGYGMICNISRGVRNNGFPGFKKEKSENETCKNKPEFSSAFGMFWVGIII